MTQKLRHLHWFGWDLRCKICKGHQLHAVLEVEPSKRRPCLGEDCGRFVNGTSEERFCRKCWLRNNRVAVFKGET